MIGRQQQNAHPSVIRSLHSYHFLGIVLYGEATKLCFTCLSQDLPECFSPDVPQNPSW